MSKELSQQLEDIRNLEGNDLIEVLNNTNEELMERFKDGVNYDGASEFAMLFIEAHARHLEYRANSIGAETKIGGIWAVSFIESKMALSEAKRKSYKPIKNLLLKIAEAHINLEDIDKDPCSITREKMRALNNLAASLPTT